MKFQKGHVPWNKNKKNCYSKDVKKRMSNAHKGIKPSEETKRKMSESHKGIKLSKEHRNILIRVNTGKIVSEETKRKISKGNKGKIVSEKTRRNQSKSLKGRYLKEESSQWKGGCDDYWHNKAWELFGSECCENCYMNNEDHKQKWKHRLEMHNNLEPKDYTIMEVEVWMTLCKECHAGLEAALENNKILYKKWDL